MVTFTFSIDVPGLEGSDWKAGDTCDVDEPLARRWELMGLGTYEGETTADQPSKAWAPKNGGEFNINEATADDIAKTLNGVGANVAKAIVDYVQEHGPIESADDLIKVKGVSQKIVDANKQALGW